MDDFLYRLFRLTRSVNKLPREDFVSLCLGRLLECDPELMAYLVGCIAARSPARTRRMLREWLDDRERSWRCRAQVPAWTDDAPAAGRADLVLDLEPVRLRVVLEVKLDDSVPSSAQLERYGRAFGGALVVPLVEARVRQRCDPPSLSWDDVLTGLCKGRPKGTLAALRHDMRRLLAQAWVGDARLCLDSGAWGRARTLISRFAAIRSRLKEVLVELGPNSGVRDALRMAIEDKSSASEPSEGWGVGIWLDEPLPGTCIDGLSLAIDEGDFSDELSWKLEARATQRFELPADTGWSPIRGLEGWYTTELHVSRGPRPLHKSDFAETLANGRIALRELHQHMKDGAWHTRGPGEAPWAPKVAVEALREGIDAWDPVYLALNQAVRQVLHQVAHPGDDGRPYRRHRHAWRTRPGRLPGSLRLLAHVPFHLETLVIGWEHAPKGFSDVLLEAWGQAGLAAPQQGTASLKLPLDEASWNASETVEKLVEALQRAVKRTARR